MEDCLFCKIAKGEIPSHKVYEDQDALAFLDISPTRHGHVLVIPKEHTGQIFELGNDLYTHLMNVCQKIARDLKSKLNAERINIKTVGEHIPDHAHIHLLPEYVDPKVKPTAEPDALAELAKQLRQ